MKPHPFEYALGLGWSDGAFCSAGFRSLDLLQKSIKLSDSARAILESEFESHRLETVDIDARDWGDGSGVEGLQVWVEAVVALLENRVNAEATARALGVASMAKGLTRQGWQDSSYWMEALQLDRPFAEGCWAEGDAIEALVTVPAALAPVATILDI